MAELVDNPESKTAQPPEPQPPQTRKEFESALRGLGFSNREAKKIAATGFHAVGESEVIDKDSAEKLICGIIDSSFGSVRNEQPEPAVETKQDPDSQNVRNGQDGAGTPPMPRNADSPDNKNENCQSQSE